MEVLVHICCAPCGVKIFGYLRQKGYQPAGFFYNPNIHPKSEHLLRQKTAKELLKKKGIRFIGSDYEPKEYFKALAGEKKLGKRCLKCWRLRLEKTVKKACKLGFDAFCSTLQVSFFQNQKVLTKIGKELETKYKIKFLDEKFDKLFEESQKESKRQGMYRQNYCGCVYSLLEKYAKFF